MQLINKQPLLYGSILFGIFIAIATAVAIKTSDSLQQRLEDTLTLQIRKQTLFEDQILILQERLILLRDIVTVDDPFEKDELITKHRALAAQFWELRSTLENMDLNADERALLNLQIEQTQKGYRLQSDLIERSIEQTDPAHYQQILDKLQPLLDAVYSDILEYRAKILASTQNEIHAAKQAYEQGWRLILFFYVITLIVGSSAVAWLAWRQYRSQQALTALNAELEQRVQARTQELEQARDHAEASKAMLQLVLDTIPLQVFWKDRDLNYLGCNKRFAKLAGFSHPRELIGHSDFDTQWAAEAPSIRDDDGHVIASGIAIIGDEKSRALPDGEQVWLSSSRIPLKSHRNAEITGVLGVQEDITARKRDEALVMEAKQEAERAALVKSQFLANMSHEIRTPLNAVLGMARIGKRDSHEDAAQQQFQQITDSGEHLLRVINDILDFSRIEAGKLEIEHAVFDYYGAVEASCAMLRERASNKSLTLHLEVDDDLPPWVLGDAHRLQQVLINLLSNAVKFTESGRIGVRVSWQDGMASVAVTDTGIGLTAEQIERLFTPFEQGDTSTTRKFGGSGLGLSISRYLMELMHGSITVTSEIGQGSTFIVSLPLPVAAAPIEQQTAPQAENDSPLHGIRVLAAEDVDINQMILEDILISHGANVELADNGQIAVDILTNEGKDAFNIILMDIQMPVMNGYDATRACKKIAPEIPVIGLTAHAMEEEKLRCLEAGMTFHLTKPIDPEKLVSTLLTALA